MISTNLALGLGFFVEVHETRFVEFIELIRLAKLNVGIRSQVDMGFKVVDLRRRAPFFPKTMAEGPSDSLTESLVELSWAKLRIADELADFVLILFNSLMPGRLIEFSSSGLNLPL